MVCGDVDLLFLMFRPAHWLDLPLFDTHSDIPAFFPEGDTRFYRVTQDLVSPSGLEQGDTTLAIFALSQCFWANEMSVIDHATLL